MTADYLPCPSCGYQNHIRRVYCRFCRRPLATSRSSSDLLPGVVRATSGAPPVVAGLGGVPPLQPASEAARVRGERPPAERRDGPLRSPRAASLGVGERLTATEKAV